MNLNMNNDTEKPKTSEAPRDQGFLERFFSTVRDNRKARRALLMIVGLAAIIMVWDFVEHGPMGLIIMPTLLAIGIPAIALINKWIES